MCEHGRAASLDTTTKSVDALAFRRQRYRLQDVAQSLVPHDRVARCCRMCGSGGVEVRLSADGVAHYGGLMVCGSVWTCPVCGARISAYRRRELQALVATANDRGWEVHLLTLTLRHNRDDSLRELLDCLREAKRRWRQYAAVRRVWASRVVGTVTALEITHGEHGWHPHMHMLVVTTRGAGPALAELGVEWLRALAVYGRDGLDGIAYNLVQQRAGGVTRAVADYAAKWGLEYELTSAGKVARSAVGRTPLALLADADHEYLAAGLWREYADTMRGRRQLMWSPGLRELVGVDDLADEQVAALDDYAGPVQVLAVIPRACWFAVCRAGLRYELLRAAEMFGQHGIDLLLSLVRMPGSAGGGSS